MIEKGSREGARGRVRGLPIRRRMNSDPGRHKTGKRRVRVRGLAPVRGVPPGAFAGKEHGFFAGVETGRSIGPGRGDAERASGYLSVGRVMRPVVFRLTTLTAKGG